jgi:DNA-binding MarR family transcriptional regulator
MVAVHGPLSPSELATLAHLERAHVSRAITELVSKGLHERGHVPNDGRRARMAITASGLRLYEDVFPQIARINQAVLGALTAGQLAAFDEALHLLTRSAEALVRSTPVTVKAARHLGGRRSGPVTPPRKVAFVNSPRERMPVRQTKR